AIVVDRVLDRLADQPLAAFLGHRLDADGRAAGEADVGHAEFALQVGDELVNVRGACRPLDAGVDILGVFPEHDHVRLARVLHRCGHAGEVADGPHVRVQIQRLSHRDVERANALPHGRAQRTLYRYYEFAEGLQRLIGQRFAVKLHGLLAAEDLNPAHAAAA